MKLAISGKGGVGKSTVAAAFALLLDQRGEKVLAVDADPDANLSSALGISEQEKKKITPLAQQRILIEERTGAKVRQYGQMFKLNPHVSDIAERYAYMHRNIALLVLGAVEKGGGGCACPENVLLKALVTDLVLYKNESLIMDMEAGIEHLGRATARGVDAMLVVIEPGQRSIESAVRIIKMAHDIGLTKIKFLANKVTCPDDAEFIGKALQDQRIIGYLPFTEEIRNSDKLGISVLDGMSDSLRMQFEGILDEVLKER